MGFEQAADTGHDDGRRNEGKTRRRLADRELSTLGYHCTVKQTVIMNNLGKDVKTLFRCKEMIQRWKSF